MTVSIPLTKGYIAIVDDCDADLAEISWYANKGRENYYAARALPGHKTLQMHRVILARILGRDLLKTEHVDHRDLNTLNNARSNLRIANYSTNQVNRNIRSNNKSGYKGVCWINREKKWHAFVGVNSKVLHLGNFNDIIEAHRHYCIAVITHYGEFANFGSNSPFLGWTLTELERGYKQLELPFGVAS